MSFNNIEYLDSRTQQMNLDTLSEEQVSFQVDKSRILELESENNTFKLQFKTKEQIWNKDRAILTQKIELLESHIYESKIRQENLQKMNEAFMNTLNDLTANPKNFSRNQHYVNNNQNKMLKDLQQLFENRLQMDPDTESKLQKSTLTIKQQQDEIEELKKKVQSAEQQASLLKRRAVDNEKDLESSFQRKQQDLEILSTEKLNDYKQLEKENQRMKQMYEKDILVLQKKHSDAMNQISKLQSGSAFENENQSNAEVKRLNNVIDTISQSHKMEIELIKQQNKNEIKMMQNSQKYAEINNPQNNQQTNDQDSSIQNQRIKQLENEKIQINTQLQNILSQFHSVSNQNSSITAALQLKDQQIEDLKNKMALMQTSMPQTCQDFFDVECQISRIEPERTKRRSIINEFSISNLAPLTNNQQSMNIIGSSTLCNGFNGNDNGLNTSHNTSSNGLNNNIQQNTGAFQNTFIPPQVPLLQNNYSSSSSNANYPINQAYGLCQSIQFNSVGGNSDLSGRNSLQQGRNYEQQQKMQEQLGVYQKQQENNDLPLNQQGFDTFGKQNGLKNKRVISTTSSSNNIGGNLKQSVEFQMNGQKFTRTEKPCQSMQQNHQQSLTMDTSIEKKSSKVGQIVQKRKLQSFENIDSQNSLQNIQMEDNNVVRRERTTTTSATYHGGQGNNINKNGNQSVSCTNIKQQKNVGSPYAQNNGTPYSSNNGATYPQNGMLINQELTNKSSTLKQLKQQKIQGNQNSRNTSLNAQKIGGLQDEQSKTHQKNISLSSTNLPQQELKKSMTETSINNTNNSIGYNNTSNINYNTNQSIISSSNLLGASHSQSFMKGNSMSQSSLLNQEQSFLVRAIQENMQEKLTLEEKMRNLEAEVQNYVMINQKSKGNSQNVFSSLVQQVMKELYSKQLNKNIFQLSKEERENVLKQEIKSLVDQIMLKPIQQRQQSQENKSIIMNSSLNKSISMEDGVFKDSKSPRYCQSGSLSVSNLLNSSSLTSSKGFLNFVNQNKENSTLKTSTNTLGSLSMKSTSSTSFSQGLQNLQGLKGQSFFDKKINQFNFNQASARNNRQLN